MDPVTLSIIVSAATFAAHLLANRIISKAPPTKTDPPFPTTFGHGELVAFIRQEISNAIALGGFANPVPSPVVPVTPNTPVDFQHILLQLLAILEKQLPQPTPVTPK